MKNVALGLIVFAIFLSGCAYTEVTSWKDPEFSGKTYGNLIVVVKTDDMKHMLVGEQSFEEIFRKNGVILNMGHNIFKPTEELTDEQFMQTLKDRNIDGIIEVNFRDQDARTNVHITDHSVSSSTTVYLKYSVNLIDVETGKIPWKASTQTEGEDLPLDAMMDSLADAVFRDLAVKGLLR